MHPMHVRLRLGPRLMPTRSPKLGRSKNHGVDCYALPQKHYSSITHLSIILFIANMFLIVFKSSHPIGPMIWQNAAGSCPRAMLFVNDIHYCFEFNHMWPDSPIITWYRRVGKVRINKPKCRVKGFLICTGI